MALKYLILQRSNRMTSWKSPRWRGHCGVCPAAVRKFDADGVAQYRSSPEAVSRTQWPTLDCKVVGLYAAGPMCNQSMLVSGELGKTNFKPNTKVDYFSLAKELIAFSPEVPRATHKRPIPPDINEAYSLDACLKMPTQ